MPDALQHADVARQLAPVMPGKRPTSASATTRPSRAGVALPAAPRTATRFADRFVLKGGVLLAVFRERRPTRDIDFQAQDLDNDPAAILAAITEIAAVGLDDGVIFDTGTATAGVIREEDPYQGVRVSTTASLATARPGFHVDVSVGDPITPAPRTVHLPRILGGEIAVRGYPLAMVHAEKIVTAISRGTTSTRWRDFADMYMLGRHHAIDGAQLTTSIREVARHRNTQLVPLGRVLADYGGIGQQRWEAWRRRQRLDDPPGSSPAANSPASGQLMCPSAQWTASVGTARTAMTTRLVPTAWRIRSPKTSRYAGTSRNPPPLASKPVNTPMPAVVATSSGRFWRRRVPASRVSCPIGHRTRRPTTTRTTPEAMSSAAPTARRDSSAPPIVPGMPPAADQAAARGRTSPDRT